MSTIRTRNLDYILRGLVILDLRKIRNEKLPLDKNIQFINQTFKLNLQEWEIQHLSQELLYDEYIFYCDDDLWITEKGKRFITKEDGYIKKYNIQKQQDILMKHAIKKHIQERIILWISLISTIIAIIGLIINAYK